MAFEKGVPVHVWVDETRPRNQGAALTAWELGQHGAPHTVIVDNAGGHLMQHGEVDLCITGTDRTTAAGDVCNKVGTYLKALAARDNGVPFYVALPHSMIDWRIRGGIRDIPIEVRESREVTHITGKIESGETREVQLTPDGTEALNVAFDVTPAKSVTGLITERGVCEASNTGLLELYPEQAAWTRPSETDLRVALIQTCLDMASSGLSFGTSGNASVRLDEDTLLITPTGLSYAALQPENISALKLDGRFFGNRKPSSEWRFHRDIFRSRPDIQAVVHCHSPFATALACRGEGIPAFHYMVAVTGGSEIRCGPYATQRAAKSSGPSTHKDCVLAKGPGRIYGGMPLVRTSPSHIAKSASPNKTGHKN